MSQARTMKLREYYTNVIKHDNIQPTDLSGGGYLNQKPTRHVQLNSQSPIRFNDTFRSQF